MELKTCPACGNDNFPNAKYCISCNAKIELVVVKQHKLTKKPPPIRLVEDDGSDVDESIEREVNADVRLANVFLNLIEKQTPLRKPRGIKFEDVATGKGSGRRGMLERGRLKDGRSGADILKEEGGNNSTLVEKFGKSANASADPIEMLDDA